jgi:hypothetical protein
LNRSRFYDLIFRRECFSPANEGLERIIHYSLFLRR